MIEGTEDTCRDCRFYSGRRECQRYPTYATRAPNDWCGEFKRSAVAVKSDGPIRSDNVLRRTHDQPDRPADNRPDNADKPDNLRYPPCLHDWAMHDWRDCPHVPDRAGLKVQNCLRCGQRRMIARIAGGIKAPPDACAADAAHDWRMVPSAGRGISGIVEQRCEICGQRRTVANSWKLIIEGDDDACQHDWIVSSKSSVGLAYKLVEVCARCGEVRHSGSEGLGEPAKPLPGPPQRILGPSEPWCPECVYDGSGPGKIICTCGQPGPDHPPSNPEE